MVLFENDWNELLKDEFEKEYYLKLRGFLKEEYSTKVIYPPMDDIFNALRYTSYKDTKIIIIGQDPYIREGQAHGLSFSVKHGAKTPPSLKNIFIEISSDIGGYVPNNGYLKKWADQGILMLNAILTVEEGKSKSHAKKGWEIFTNKIIEILNDKDEQVIFLLWGKDAQDKASFVTNPNHKILMATHPSPLAGGKFFGCKHFSQVNDFLKDDKKIDWQIENI